MVARVTTVQRSPADEAREFKEDYTIPALRKLPGFMGAYFLADREKGTGISITLWKDQAAENASSASSSERRDQEARLTGAIFETVDTYEVIAQAS